MLLVAGTALVLSLWAGVEIVSMGVEATQGQAGPGRIVADVDSATLEIALLAMVSLAVAAVLQALNLWLVRFLEGYYRPISWLQPLARCRFGRLRRRLEATAHEYKEEEQAGEVSRETREHYRLLCRQLATRYPDQERFVLATSFGNHLRAAEVYSRVVYGADCSTTTIIAH
jgi:hypothetical protein